MSNHNIDQKNPKTPLVSGHSNESRNFFWILLRTNLFLQNKCIKIMIALMIDDESLRVLVKGIWVMRGSECGMDQYSVVPRLDLRGNMHRGREGKGKGKQKK